MKDISVVVSFPSAIVGRLRPFISTEEPRYYLNGIHIKPQPVGVRFEATNGHILGVEYAADISASEEIILSLPKPAILTSAIGRLGGLFTVYKTPSGHVLGVKKLAANSDAAPGIFENDMLFSRCAIDGTFPDIDRVIPRDVFDPSPGVFNHKYMSIVANAIGSQYVKPLGRDGMSPAVAYNKDQTFIAVIMPMRDDFSPQPLPAWLSTARQKAA